MDLLRRGVEALEQLATAGQTFAEEAAEAARVVLPVAEVRSTSRPSLVRPAY